MNNNINGNKMHVIDCNSLVKNYPGVHETQVLKGIDLVIEQGEQAAILGQSGSGKSTLLHILGALDYASSGSVKVLGQDLSKLKDNELAQFRNENMGFIYQFHHLLMEFSALENVMMPLLIAGIDSDTAKEKATQMLMLVGVEHRLYHRPSELSGGERQRVAIARALVNEPKLVLADEPTGNLDKTNAQAVFDLFLKINQELNTTLVVVTHDQALAQRFQRVIQLDDGHVVR